MAAARELAAGQNWSDFGHWRAREVGEKKEEREGVRFHALPAAEEHRGDRISQEKVAPAVCSVRQRSAPGGGLQGGKQAGGDGAGQGRALRRRATAHARRGERAQARRACGGGCSVSTVVRLSVLWQRRLSDPGPPGWVHNIV
jgi:hypothetical protein